MIRNLVGIAAGIAVATVLAMIIEAVGNQIFPPPQLLDVTSQPPATANLPAEIWIFPVLSWFLGPFAGGALAVRLSRNSASAWAVAGAFIFGMVLRLLLARQPLWLMAAGILAPLLGAWLAQRLTPRSGDA